MATPDVVEIIVIGAGGHGSEVASYIRDLADTGASVRLRGFVDENKPKGSFLGSEILGDFETLATFVRGHEDRVFRYVTAVGDNRLRGRLVDKVRALGMTNLSAWTLVHPRACVGRDVEIGEGTCLAPGSIVTTRVRVGRHCILNVKASVSHDTVIDGFVNLNPGAVVCGNVRIGEGCYIGAGATIIENVTIGPWSVIGAGAVVIRDVPANVTAVGVPAKVLTRSEVATA